VVYYLFISSVNIKPTRHRFGFSLAWDWQKRVLPASAIFWLPRDNWMLAVNSAYKLSSSLSLCLCLAEHLNAKSFQSFIYFTISIKPDIPNIKRHWLPTVKSCNGYLIVAKKGTVAIGIL
jgi:hypothetical protein